MVSVLNFFLVYLLHFMSYAIAFQVLLPQNDNFQHIGDGTLKVNNNNIGILVNGIAFIVITTI